MRPIGPSPTMRLTLPEPVSRVEQDVPRPITAIEKSLFANEVAEQIREVFDPEIPINVYDLGLIYDIQVDESRNVHIMMTLTSPMCPVAGSLPGEVEDAARRTPGVGTVFVE